MPLFGNQGIAKKLDSSGKFFLIFTVVVFLLFSKTANSSNFSSSNFTVQNPVVDSGTAASSSANFGLGQSIGQVAPGKSSSSSFQLWSGFQYYFKVNANTLTATPGQNQVTLNWTAPQTFLGLQITSYDAGIGTTSGSYVFQNVGNALTFTFTGLNAGTTYFFRVRAKSGSQVVVFSNEATATPTGGAQTAPPTGGPAVSQPPPQQQGSAAVDLQGLAYPFSKVTVLQDGNVIATTTADPAANFEVTVNNLAAGTYNFSLYAEDQNGKRSPAVSIVHSILDHTVTKIGGLLLAPSIGTNFDTVKQGDTINFFGYTVPNSSVNLFIHSGTQQTFTAASAENGAWSKALNTIQLELGNHTGKSQTASGNLLSPYSDEIGFKVGTENILNTKNCGVADLNCDGRVDLTDLSILLYYYEQQSIEQKVDLNSDGQVNITDFSILLYHWTG